MSSETPSSPEPQLPQTSSSTNSQSVGSSDRYVLYVWPGEWNLPSLDAECLTAMVITKIFNFSTHFNSIFKKNELVYRHQISLLSNCIETLNKKRKFKCKFNVN